ncbi:DUF6279 family lipoprotein [Allohahella marinimesophila]|uniref:Lipoprotein n=1 Tax=Allohahella marinimesophila TaxID=1054972 RepID=A0ABP7Q0M5_9GAMM
MPQLSVRHSGVKLVSVLLLCLSLSGCFSFAFWFERMDTLVMWRLDDMLDLTDSQKEEVEPVIVELREWLRQDGFPDLIPRLENIEQLWAAGESEAALATFEQEASTIIDRFLEASWPAVKPLLIRITPANAEAYREYSEEKMADWFDESETLEAKVEDRVERFEDWFGDLDRRQVQLVRQRTELLDNELQIRMQNSRHRRERFLQLALDEDLAALETMFKHPSNFQTPAYVQWRAQERDQIVSSLHALFPTLDSGQRKHAGERLEDWIDRLQEVLD